MPWRVLEETGIDVYRNLAIDEALARVNAKGKEKSCTIRFWQSNRSVVIGRFQCVHEEANLAFCERERIAIARRFTGGGGVYHDLGNLNFTICANQSEPYVSGNLMEFYQTFIGAIRDGLRAIGIPARYDENRACIRVGDKKVSGTAGWIKRGVSFLHGTLLLDTDLNTLRKALTPEVGQQVFIRDKTRIRCKPSKRDIITNICDAVSNRPSRQQVQRAIVLSVQDTTGSEFVLSSLTEEEKDTAEALYQSRYSQSAWNLGTLAQTEQAG